MITSDAIVFAFLVESIIMVWNWNRSIMDIVHELCIYMYRHYWYYFNILIENNWFSHLLQIMSVFHGGDKISPQI